MRRLLIAATVILVTLLALPAAPRGQTHGDTSYASIDGIALAYMRYAFAS